MPKLKLNLQITADDLEELTIILDAIKRQINDGFECGYDEYFERFDWYIDEIETETEALNA